MPILYSVALVTLHTIAASAMPAGSLRDLVLRLSTDRPRYRLGEPVTFTLTIRNHATERTWGFFRIGQDALTELHYLHAEGPYVRLAGNMEASTVGRADDEAIAPPTVIEPGGEARVMLTLCMDHRLGSLILSKPGEYKFRVISRPQGERNPIVLESDIAIVHAEAPPAAQADAWFAYEESGLARLVEAPRSYVRENRQIVGKAKQFLEVHAAGTYADHVRAALKEALLSLSRRGKATTEERELYEKLHSEGHQQR